MESKLHYRCGINISLATVKIHHTLNVKAALCGIEIAPSLNIVPPYEQNSNIALIISSTQKQKSLLDIKVHYLVSKFLYPLNVNTSLSIIKTALSSVKSALVEANSIQYKNSNIQCVWEVDNVLSPHGVYSYCQPQTDGANTRLLILFLLASIYQQ